jgi:uncharacterized protein with FMN-binding domain
MLRRAVTCLYCVVALSVPAGNALALTRAARSASKKVVSTVTVTGPSIKCHRWGFMEVQLKVIKTVVTTGTKQAVTIKITAVNWPIYPNHTSRSKYINAQALPLLQQETLQLQANAGKELENISGASNTTVAWLASLQAALVQAETP